MSNESCDTYSDWLIVKHTIKFEDKIVLHTIIMTKQKSCMPKGKCENCPSQTLATTRNLSYTEKPGNVGK